MSEVDSTSFPSNVTAAGGELWEAVDHASVSDKSASAPRDADVDVEALLLDMSSFSSPLSPSPPQSLQPQSLQPPPIPVSPPVFSALHEHSLVAKSVRIDPSIVIEEDIGLFVSPIPYLVVKTRRLMDGGKMFVNICGCSPEQEHELSHSVRELSTAAGSSDVTGCTVSVGYHFMRASLVDEPYLSLASEDRVALSSSSILSCSGIRDIEDHKDLSSPSSCWTCDVVVNQQAIGLMSDARNGVEGGLLDQVVICLYAWINLFTYLCLYVTICIVVCGYTVIYR
jgi:hypothetical protein